MVRPSSTGLCLSAPAWSEDHETAFRRTWLLTSWLLALRLEVRKGTVLSCSSEDYPEVGAEGSSKGQDDLGEGTVWRMTQLAGNGKVAWGKVGRNSLRKGLRQRSARVLCVLVLTRVLDLGTGIVQYLPLLLLNMATCCGDCMPLASVISMWHASSCLHAVWQPGSLGMGAVSRCKDEDGPLEIPPCQHCDGCGPPWAVRSPAEEGNGLQLVGNAGRRRLVVCVWGWLGALWRRPWGNSFYFL